ncbi:MAG: Fur family transcriptional regulator [Alphaproteobacteria bacterium]
MKKNRKERVLSLIQASDTPLTAYDILDKMKIEGVRAPPTIYRILSQLLEDGAVHRLESLNAFVACGKKDHDHSGYFTICLKCCKTTEFSSESIDSSLKELLAVSGFTVKQVALEVSGVCADCRASVEC